MLYVAIVPPATSSCSPSSCSSDRLAFRGTFVDVTLRLSSSQLEAIERRGIPVPHYDRAALSPRILHIGVGGFHRAHLARYVDELAEAGGDWGFGASASSTPIVESHVSSSRRITCTP